MSRWGRFDLTKRPGSIWLLLCLVALIAGFILIRYFDTEITAYTRNLYIGRDDLSDRFFRDLTNLWSSELIWLMVFCVVLWIIYTSRSIPSPTSLINSQRRIFKNGLLSVSIVSAAAIITVAVIVLEAFPNSSDEYVYLFQAQTMITGKLWEHTHQLQEFFSFNHIASKDGFLVGRFPPGYPWLLSLSYLVGLPPVLVNPILALITLIVFYIYCKKGYGEEVAFWASLTLAFTGFFIFNSASFFSHTSCLLMILLFVHFFYKYGETRRPVFLLLAGFFIGYAMTIRYLTGLLALAPFLPYAFLRFRWSAIRVLALVGVGALVPIMFMFWYNYAITGDPLLPVTQWAYTDEKLGFVNDHTPAKGIEHLVRRAGLFIYWTSVGFLALAIGAVATIIKTRGWRNTQPEHYIFFLLIIGHFFYYHMGGNQYGPRFLFEGFPFLVALIISWAINSRSAFVHALLYASILVAAAKVPFVAVREGMIIDERQNIYDVAQQKRLNNALVFVSISTCAIRPMPAEDLTRNDPGFDGDVLYVLDKPDSNKMIMDYFPERDVYRYVRDAESSAGTIVLVRPAVSGRPERVGQMTHASEKD